MDIPERFFQERMVYRSFSSGLIMLGLINKSGIRFDQTDMVPDQFSLVMVLRGKGRYKDADGGTWDLAPGSVFCRIPGKTHSTVLDPNSGWQECYIAVSTEAYRFLTVEGIWALSVPVFRVEPDIAWLDQLLLLVQKAVHAPDHEIPACWAEAVGLACRLMDAQSTGGDEGYTERLRQACRLLGDDLDRPLNMEEVAGLCNMSYSLFRKEFKKMTGQSPGLYRIRRRIDRACALLLSSARPVQDIAFELGYPDPYTFSEQFKKVTGTSPTGFRLRRG